MKLELETAGGKKETETRFCGDETRTDWEKRLGFEGGMRWD